MSDMGQLFRQAREYGRVRVTTLQNGRYAAFIDFNTINHVELQAQSGFDCETPEEALAQAIAKAIEIVRSMEATITPLMKFLPKESEGA